MKLGINIEPLSIKYPPIDDLPKDLLEKGEEGKFRATHKIKPFLEQYQSEKHPHKISHIHFQFGNIGGKWVTKMFHKKKPVRIVYSNANDPLLEEMKKEMPSIVNFPPATSSTPIARTFREMGLKWIAEQFFASINYLAFDEPILYTVNPDLLVIPHEEANTILKHCNSDPDPKNTKNGQNQNHHDICDIELDNPCFVEIKAYPEITEIGEKEVLQSFNYSVLGGRTLLLTTGSIGDLNTIKILNEDPKLNDQEEEGYDQKIYKKFVKEVGNKYRKKIHEIDLHQGQDSYDTRGIYISAKSKLKKMYKYTKNWPNTISFKILTSPESILTFIKNGEGLGIIEPQAFSDLLLEKKLSKAAHLFENIRKRSIEEIILNPTLLYPK